MQTWVRRLFKYSEHNDEKSKHLRPLSLFCGNGICTIVALPPHRHRIRANIYKTDFQKPSRSRMIVFHPSISHCSQALNPLLVWVHRAYNQCTGEFPINTTHSTSVASLTPSPHTLKAQQPLMEPICMCRHVRSAHIHKTCLFISSFR